MYWAVSLNVIAFDTKEAAEAFRDALMDAFDAMPEAAEYAAIGKVAEELGD